MSRFKKISIILASLLWLTPALVNAQLPVSEVSTAMPITAPVTAPSAASIVPASTAMDTIVPSQISIATISTALSGAVCTFSSVANTLLQGQVGVNLNQPASCAAVVPAALPVTQHQLSFSPAYNHSVSIKVIPPVAVIQPFHILPSTGQEELPVLPLPLVSLMIALALVGIASLVDYRSTLLATKTNLRTSLSLSELQVFLC